jgi:anti-sigma factor RsiW
VKIEQSIKASKDPWWAKAWVTAVTATAALLLMAGFITLWLQRPRADEQALNELADLHVSALASANPVDVVSTDRHTVKPWFEGKLPFSFDLPDLANSQFKLLGGRLAYFQQNPGAQLLFQLRKHQISVFIFQNRGGAERLSSGSWLGPELGFNNETWAAGGLRYFVIGDCGAADIHRLSELLKD